MTGTCHRCGAELVEGARFCTDCGARVAPDGQAATTPPGAGVTGPEGVTARLVECPECGASNAASRPLCARCQAPLRDEVPGGDALPDTVAVTPSPLATGVRYRDANPYVLSLVLLAGLVIAGALLALVTSRVTASNSTGADGVEVVAATASSALEDFEAARAIDGDPATAWTESAAGPGVGEYLELRLAEVVDVMRVVIWNGDQRDETSYADNGRVASLRIEAADRQFRVNLLDVTGPQAIDLPAPLTTDRVRLIIETAVAGERYTDLAISEVVVEAG